MGLPAGERRSSTTRTLSGCSPMRACETTPSAKLCFARAMPLLAPNRSTTTRSGFASLKLSTLSIGPVASISTPLPLETMLLIFGAAADAAGAADGVDDGVAASEVAVGAGSGVVSGATSGGPGWLGAGWLAAVPLGRTSTTISSPWGFTS